MTFLVSGKPFPVRNCTLANQTYTSVEVKCVAGYDGGLPQKFILEVYHGDVDFLSSSQPLYNVSNADEPSFSLAGLEASVEAGVHVAVYAVNAKGRSQPVILSEVTYRDAEKRTGKKYSPFLFFPFSASLVPLRSSERISVSIFATVYARRSIDETSKGENCEKSPDRKDIDGD